MYFKTLLIIQSTLLFIRNRLELTKCAYDSNNTHYVRVAVILVFVGVWHLLGACKISENGAFPVRNRLVLSFNELSAIR